MKSGDYQPGARMPQLSIFCFFLGYCKMQWISFDMCNGVMSYAFNSCRKESIDLAKKKFKKKNFAKAGWAPRPTQLLKK